MMDAPSMEAMSIFMIVEPKSVTSPQQDDAQTTNSPQDAPQLQESSPYAPN